MTVTILFFLLFQAWLGPVLLGQQTFIWANGAGGSWGQATNWSGGLIGAGQDNAANFSRLRLENDPVVTLDGDREIGHLTFWDLTAPRATWTVTAGSGGVLTLNVSAGLARIGVGTSAVASIRAPLAGLAGLNKNDAGTLTLLGDHTFGGPTVISGGFLQLGDGLTANGTLASSWVTNHTTLSLNPYGLGTMTNQIAGAGLVQKIGLGEMLLAGSNTYDGETLVSEGILRAGNSWALGSTNGVTRITEGATLDVNGLVLGEERVLVRGGGVGGQGAIVNNLVELTKVLQYVTLEGNATFGGTTRWDIRTNGLPGTAVLNGNGHRLTKVGSNFVWIVGAGETGLGAIDILEGRLGFEEGSSMGDPQATMTVASNATVGLFSYGTGYSVSKMLVLEDGGGIYCSGAGGFMEFAGATTLNGMNSVLMNRTATLTMSSRIGGSGGLIKSGTGTLLLNGTNSFTGPLRVVEGIFGGTGSVSGPVSVEAGTFSPGVRGIGTFTVSNDLTLSARTLMEINGTTGAGDSVVGIGTVTYGGTLVVTNLGGLPSKNQQYRLFRAAAYAGGFTNVTLPGVTAGYKWSNNLMVDGSITVVPDVSTVPTNMVAAYNGTELTLSWPASHKGWRLESQTNGLDVGLRHNWVTVTGSASTNRMVIPLTVRDVTIFYRMVYP